MAETRRAAAGGRSLVGLLIALITAAVVWWTQGDAGNDTATDPSSGDTPSVSQSPTSEPSDSNTAAPDSDLPVVQVADLPPQAAETLRLIDAGGPFPYDRDGITFENREDLLPDHPEGYYKEYTVETPGSDDRGARRIVAGEGGEFYWTEDHYRSFSRIQR